MMKTVIEIRDAIREGKVTALEVVTHYLQTIEEKNSEIGAFLEVYKDEAIEAAKKIDEMKKNGEELPRLAGVPIGVKDNMCHEGHVASCSSRMLEGWVSPYTATAVKRLVDAGAIVVGRLNMDEFAMGSSTETSAYMKTRNPWDTAKVPGGSSGGSAAAVASGMVPVALGSDTGGSIRQPASLCGIVGMKPSYGRVSRHGLIALASSLDQIGPLTHTVEDAALILEVMEGKDENDATTVDFGTTTVAELLTPSVKGKKLGVPKSFFANGLDPEIKKTVEDAITVLKAQGAEIVEVDLTLAPYALPAYYIIQPAEASSNLARFDGMRYANRAPGNLKESYLQARQTGFGKEVKRRIMLGAFILSAGYYDAYYKKALAVKNGMYHEFMEVMKTVDAIITPTSPSVAWNLDEKFADPIAMYLSDIYTTGANIMGIPAISVPCGFVNDLPVGLQIMGKPGDDFSVMNIAAAYQQSTDWNTFA